MFDFSEQVALVTGASRGIGRRVAEDLSIHGASVALVSRTEAEIEGVAAAVAAEGGPTLGVAMDISSPPSVQEGVSRVLEEFGRIDILVNNAGIVRDKLLLRMTEEDWRQVLSTNLDGVFRVTRAVLRSMVRQRYGRVVNPGQINYVSSKAGIIGFTKALAREVAARNITVNAVAPGFIDTDMTRRLPARARSGLEATIPLRRPGTVEEVAYGVRFLASKEAGYVTGHVLNVNGGMYM